MAKKIKGIKYTALLTLEGYQRIAKELRRIKTEKLPAIRAKLMEATGDEAIGLQKEKMDCLRRILSINQLFSAAEVIFNGARSPALQIEEKVQEAVKSMSKEIVSLEHYETKNEYVAMLIGHRIASLELDIKRFVI